MQAANTKPETRGQSTGSSPLNNNSNNTRPPVIAASSHPKLIPRPNPAPDPSVTQSLAQGYSNAVTPTSTAPTIDPELSIHPTLRSPGFVPTAIMMPSGVPPPTEHPGAIPVGANPPAPSSPEDLSPDGRKAKRELSQSKRAAQNRAAQRAFRQRKEGYIKKLEQQVRDYGEMEQQFKVLQTENYSLREYIVHLQSRLIDAQVEPPQPPPNINLSASVPSPAMHGLPQQPPPAQEEAPPAEPTPNTGSAAGTAALDAVAQAVQSLSRSDASSFKPEPTAAESQAAEDARTAQELARQLAQAGEGVPAANM